VFLISDYIITRTVNMNKFNSLMKSVVVDSYECEWKFSLKNITYATAERKKLLGFLSYTRLGVILFTISLLVEVL